MAFSIADFIRTNKVFIIWAALGALIYLFRDLFGLVFITFIMCFITASVIRLLPERLARHRRPIVVLVYLGFLVLVGVFLVFLTPRLISEAGNFGEQLPRAMLTVEAWLRNSAGQHPALAGALMQVREFLTPEQVVLKGWGLGWGLFEKGLQYTSWFFLGLMFSFLIMMDLPRLGRSVKALRNSGLSDFYEETADSVVLFAKTVGENFRAQLLISALDGLVATVGLYLLNVDGVVLLGSLVFVCGLIPVLGGLISAVPIFLMAVNSGGISLAMWAMALMIGISLLETYVFSPRVLSSVMNINPVMTLIILFIAYSVAGIWGMLLGVPVAVYIYRQIIDANNIMDI